MRKICTLLFFVTISLLQVVNGQTVFVHPGGLHSQADLDRMKTKVAEGAHPWIDDWNNLIQDPKAQNTYGASPRADMNLRQVMSRDGDAAYYNAIRWYISGDSTYAECAVRIFNDYSSTVNQIPTFGNTDIFGLGGIGMAKLVMAAEIMRLYDGWQSSDFDQFKAMMVNYFYPVCHDFLTNHNGRCDMYYWTNWDANNIGALVAIGVLCDNQAIFDEGVEYFKHGIGAGSIEHAVPILHGDLGQWHETGRDQSHGFLGVGLLGTICQMAWTQGDDLYGYDDNRVLKGAEYGAKYNFTNLDVPFEPYNNCDNVNHTVVSPDGRTNFRPIWERLYNHYVVEEGLSAPYVEMAARMHRSEGGGGDYGPNSGGFDNLGFGTLMYSLDK